MSMTLLISNNVKVQSCYRATSKKKTRTVACPSKEIKIIKENPALIQRIMSK